MSDYIENLKNLGINDITFIIGGSNGVNDEVRKRAKLLLKFSEFYFSTSTYDTLWNNYIDGLPFLII